MRILIIGPELQSPSVVTGLQKFNVFLARSLRGMGHEVRYAIQQPNVSQHTRPQAESLTGCRTIWLDHRGADYNKAFAGCDLLILSGAQLDYAGILRASRCPALVWTHGQHISPLAHWDGAELRRPGVRYVCTNCLHLAEAKARGYEDQAVAFDMPVQFAPCPVRLPVSYCAAVGTLEPRKKYQSIAEIAALVGMDARVFGAATHESVRTIVRDAPSLSYMGMQPHGTVLHEVANASFLLHAAEIEGRPTAVLEAMGLGVPVIVPDLPIYREFVDPQRNILYNPAQPEKAITKAALNRLRKPENREALAKETHEKYGLEVFMRALEELFRRAGR